MTQSALGSMDFLETVWVTSAATVLPREPHATLILVYVWRLATIARVPS